MDLSTLKLHAPSSVLALGPTLCGKSTLVEKIICNTNTVFAGTKFSQVVWSYAPHTRDDNRFARIKSCLDRQNIRSKFIEDIPVEHITGKKLFDHNNNDNYLLVIDDCLFSSKHVNHVLELLFSHWMHHMRITTIVVSQGLPSATATQRGLVSSLLRCTSYLILYSDRRMCPIVKHVARNFFPSEEYRLMLPYNYLLSQILPYQYVIVDFVGNNVDMAVRQGVCMPHEKNYIFQFSSDPEFLSDDRD